jgi:hypothetical protein
MAPHVVYAMHPTNQDSSGKRLKLLDAAGDLEKRWPGQQAVAQTALH